MITQYKNMQIMASKTNVNRGVKGRVFVYNWIKDVINLKIYISIYIYFKIKKNHKESKRGRKVQRNYKIARKQ